MMLVTMGTSQNNQQRLCLSMRKIPGVADDGDEDTKI